MQGPHPSKKYKGAAPGVQSEPDVFSSNHIFPFQSGCSQEIWNSRLGMHPPKICSFGTLAKKRESERARERERSGIS